MALQRRAFAVGVAAVLLGMLVPWTAGPAGATLTPLRVAVFGDNRTDDVLRAQGFDAVLVTDTQLQDPDFLVDFDAFYYTRNGTDFGESLSPAARESVRSFVGERGRTVLLNGDFADALTVPDQAVETLTVNAVRWAAQTGHGFVGELQGAAAALTSNDVEVQPLGLLDGHAGPIGYKLGDVVRSITATEIGADHPVLADVPLPATPAKVEFGAQLTIEDPTLVLAVYPSGNPAIVARVDEPLRVAVYGDNATDDLLDARGMDAQIVTGAQLDQPGFLDQFDVFYSTRNGIEFPEPLSLAATRNVEAFVGQTGRVVLLNGDFADPLLTYDQRIERLTLNAVRWAGAQGHGYVGELHGAVAGLTSNSDDLHPLGFVEGHADPIRFGGGDVISTILPTASGAGHPVLDRVELPHTPTLAEFGAPLSGVDIARVLAVYPSGNPAIVAEQLVNLPPSIEMMGPEDGATYGYEDVPEATCSVRDDRDGTLVVSPQVGPITGPRSTDGLGERTLTCTYTDTGGLSAAASVTYAIVDRVGPDITAPDGISGVEATGPGGAVIEFEAQADDALPGAVSLECTPPSGYRFALGATEVICTATDEADNESTESFTVKVVDTTAPTLSSQVGLVVEATSAAGAEVDFAVPTATDIVDLAVPVDCDATPGPFPLGLTVVTCRAADTAGNQAETSFSISVQDRSAPVVSAPAALSVEATGPEGAVVDYGAVPATDQVDGPVAATCTPPSGDVFPIGTVTVSCEATDSAGNVGSSSFAVTVRDTTPPAFGPVDEIVGEATGPIGTAVDFAVPVAHDAVSGPLEATCPSSPGDEFPLGTTLLSCTAVDWAGNAASVTLRITVRDTTGPELPALDGVGVEATSAAGALATFDVDDANDVVDGPLPLTCTPGSGATFPLGTSQVSCSAVDAAGNRSTSTFDVLVRDTVAPVLVLPANRVVPAESAAGSVVAHVVTGHDGVTADVAVSCEPPSGSTFPLGTTTVECTATDEAGNRTQGSFEIQVADQAAPVVAVPPDFSVEATTAAGAVVTFPSPTAEDAVDGVLPVACDREPWAVFPLGTTTVTCVATDAAGNTGTNGFDITVEDTTGPVFEGVPTAITVPVQGCAPGTPVGAACVLGAAVAYATPTAVDLVSGAVPVACTPPSGSFLSAGTHTVTCTARDGADNGSEVSFEVHVVYTGFQVRPPIDVDGTSVFKLGSTVPVKFVVDAASPDLHARLFLTKNGSETSEVVTATARSGASTGNEFRYTDGQYVFNLDTRLLSAGQWTLHVELGDGVARSASIGLRR